MATEKQMAANRRNCMKSTGPRTAAGKARASRNSLKLGLLAQAVVVSGRVVNESPEEYEGLCREFQVRLAPVGLLEEMLTGQIAATAWRLRRVRQAEAGEIVLSVDQGEWQRNHKSIREKFPMLGLQGDPASDLEGSALGNSMLREWLELVREAVEESGELTEAAVKIPFEGTKNGVSKALERLRQELSPCRDGADAGEHREAMKRKALARIDAMILKRDKLREECEERERSEEQARQSAAVLPREETLGKIMRYETMLERQLFRAINQLERLQARRLKNGETGFHFRQGFRRGQNGGQETHQNAILQNEANLQKEESPYFTR